MVVVIKNNEKTKFPRKREVALITEYKHKYTGKQ